ncbi:probable metal-nicotianamine transporter ysl7 [Phtheirospermum japonicum]|uniref:Probable metal-nicotianamine transporter ysl7 n=1 Tax=Phtheirospermum japonicum TaxID=374723 RepID=A0A830D2J8_9LAMI|nr:probable metal-nicotianamine transporter ysl7 [Phtheirospermum japonicum]
MKVNRMPRIKLTKNALKVSCFCHGGTSLPSNILSTDSFFSSSSAAKFRSVSVSSPSVFLVILEDRSMALFGSFVVVVVIIILSFFTVS